MIIQKYKILSKLFRIYFKLSYFFFLSGFILGNISIPAQSKINKFASIDSIIETAISDSSFPGAVLLVQMNGKIIYRKAYGHYTYDPASGNISLNTMFDLASCTKVVATTTAAMICYDRGLFNIDDKVSEYLPQFGNNGKENITIRNLLVHDSGLPPDIKSYKIYNPNENKTNEVMNEIYDDSLLYPTGTKSVYSDLNFIILGEIIEKVTGVSLDKFCYKNIFKPLKMKSTMFNPPSSLINRIAPTEIDNYWRFRLIRGTVHDETAQLLGGVAGHAGLFSTAGDIAKLMQMLLQ